MVKLSNKHQESILGTNETGFKETGELIAKFLIFIICVSFCLVYNIFFIPLILILGLLIYNKFKDRKV
jgi:hypothetical protein